jgi:hypothetical protein
MTTLQENVNQWCYSKNTWNSNTRKLFNGGNMKLPSKTQVLKFQIEADIKLLQEKKITLTNDFENRFVLLTKNSRSHSYCL